MGYLALNKTTFVPPRRQRRPPEKTTADGIMMEKLNVELIKLNESILRIEAIHDGLVATYNKNHPAFAVKPGDHIVKVNGKCRNAQAMLDELMEMDFLKITMRRVPPTPIASLILSR